MSFLPLNEDISSVLLENYNSIKNDYLCLLENNFTDFISIEQILSEPKNTGHYWQVCLLMWNKEVPSTLPEKLRNSKTIKFLETLKIKPTIAIFSKLLPGAVIEKHGDYDDVYIDGLKIPEKYEYRETGLIKYHFALDVPIDGECAIIVEGDKKIIQNRDIYCFDEGSCHEAYNRSEFDRGILILSFMKKDLGINV